MLNTFYWSSLIPFNEASDEISHYSVPHYIYINKRLPVLFKNEKITIVNNLASYASQGFLHSLVAVGIMNLLDNFYTEKNLYKACRISSHLFGFFYAFFLCLFAHNLFSKNDLFIYRYVFIIYGLLIPQVTYIFSYFNHDAFSLMSVIISFFIFSEQIKNQNLRESLLLGISISLLLLSKINFYILILFLMLAQIIFIKQKNIFWAIRFYSFSLFVIFVLSGWFFIRNWLLYKDFLGYESFIKINYSIVGEMPKSLITLGFNKLYSFKVWLFWFSTSIATFWAGFNLKIRYPIDFYIFILIPFHLITFISFIVLSLKSKFQNLFSFSIKKFSIKNYQWALILIIMIILVIIQSMLHSIFSLFQAQGRYWYAVFPLWLIIFTLPVIFYLKKLFNSKIIIFVMLIVLLFFNVSTSFFLLMPSYKSKKSILKNYGKENERIRLFFLK